MACCGKKTDKYTFQPDYTTLALSEKFYSRFEHLDLVGKQSERVQHYCAEMDKIRDYDAREHLLVPRYSNQEYGWWPDYKVERCKDDYYHSQRFRQDIKELYREQAKHKCLADYCQNKKLLKFDHWKIV